MTKLSLRVALLTSARSWRGSTVSLSGIATGLRKRGHDIRLLVGEEEIAAAIRRLGIPVDVLPSRNTGWRETMALRRILRKYSIQALVADRPRDLRLGALASLDRPLPLIYRYNVRRDRPPADLVTRLAYRRVAATIFLTPGWAERTLIRAPFMGKSPYRVIWNGVDADAYRPDPEAGRAFRERHALGPGPVLVASGALFPDKRLDVLLDALALLGSSAPVLAICGVGMEEPVLRAQADRLGLPVRFMGFLSTEEMVAAYNAATCVVHAGDVETFGRSVAEAMACARPVVAVRANALIDVVGDAGVLVAPNDPGALAAGVEVVLRDPALQQRLGQAARARCIELFSNERSISAYESMFLDLGARS